MATMQPGVPLYQVEFEVLQASPRTGRLWVEVGGERIGIGGYAVTVVAGQILAPPASV